MKLSLSYMDPVFLDELNRIVEGVVLNPCLSRQQEKDLKILLDNIQAGTYAAHEVAKMLYDFNRGLK